MRILTIGDLHGLDCWKKVSPENYDLIVFVGDYVDSFTVSDEDILRNFREIIQFRLDWPEKIVLLLGNHEIGYINPYYRCSGYRYTLEAEVRAIYKKHSQLFRVAHQWENYLWTHAGIQQEYYRKNILPKVIDSDENLAATLQRLFSEKYAPLFEVGYERGGMRNEIGGPFWIDRHALVKNPLQGFDQVVGHTPVKKIEIFRPDALPETLRPVNLSEHDKSKGEGMLRWLMPNTSVTFCDCLEHGNRDFFDLEIIPW